MLFIYPMWDNEAQRIGKKKCTRIGYALHEIAELIGFIGLLMLLGVIGYIAFKVVRGSFRACILWLLAIPFVFGLFGEIIFYFSWKLAYRKGFEYNYDTREASWIENGKRCTYRFERNKNNK